VAVGGVGELETEHLGVRLCLLHAVRGRLVGCLGFDHGERKIASVAQQVVDAPWRLANEACASRDDPAIGDGSLLGNGVRIVVPARLLEQGNDELPAGVGFGRHAPLLAAPVPDDAVPQLRA
jgi:hypothetical protein